MDKIAKKLLEDVIEEVKENRVQPLSSRLQERLIVFADTKQRVQSGNGYCTCETPEQPWWGNAFTCERCNRPYKIVVDMGSEKK